MRTIRFAPARAFHVLSLAIMSAAIGAGLARYFGVLAGFAMGLALAYVFSTLVEMLLAPAGRIARSERILAGVFALALMGMTMGLSYGTLYAALFAQSSALDDFAHARQRVERQLETSVLANAEGAVNAFAAWQQYSARRARQEGQGGGTCPARAASLGSRGPIAMWREAEAGIAAHLHEELQASTAALREPATALKGRKANNFSEAMEITRSLNAVIEQAEALARGSFVASAQATLARQAASEITWPGGAVFRCGDSARDELIERARAALAGLADTRRNPPIAPLMPGIDLANPQELTVRGLLRAFNVIGLMLTAGQVGSFADDPLMLQALREKGAINRETLGFFIAALIELCVLFTGFLAAREGPPPFAFRPDQWLAERAQRLRQRKGEWRRAFGWAGQGGLRLGLNLLFAAHDGEDTAPPPAVEADLREAAAAWAPLLEPLLLAHQDGSYLIVPQAPRFARAMLAAQALEYQRLAAALNMEVSWEKLSGFGPAAARFQRLLPDAARQYYAVFKLAPTFAQALRLCLLSQHRAALAT